MELVALHQAWGIVGAIKPTDPMYPYALNHLSTLYKVVRRIEMIATINECCELLDCPNRCVEIISSLHQKDLFNNKEFMESSFCYQERYTVSKTFVSAEDFLIYVIDCMSL